MNQNKMKIVNMESWESMGGNLERKKDRGNIE